MKTSIFQSYIDELIKSKALERVRLEEERLAILKQTAFAANILKEKYGAKEVYLFGSLLSSDRFHSYSDVDLAASNLSPDTFFKACADVSSIFDNCEVDLIDLNHCDESLKIEILESGEKL